MNNSYLAVESISLNVEEPVDRSNNLREREAELVKILSAIEGVQKSREWSTLKEKVFDGVEDGLRKRIEVEAKKATPDALVLNRLTGQLLWAEKYADLSKLAVVFRTELTNIRKQNAQKSPG